MARQLCDQCAIATMADNGSPYGLIKDACLVLEDDKVLWVGSKMDLPTEHKALTAHSMGHRLITPGLVDCHTHLVHGGDRAREFELRLEGASYEEIAIAGGGIISTVTATRSASHEALLAQTLPRVDALLAEGVTSLEIKSGYGLDVETELRMLEVAREIGNQRDVAIRTTFLGAHAVPPEYVGRGDDYLDEICLPTLREAHARGLVDAVDAFCEAIAFSTDQVRKVFEVARELQLPVKLHAEQLSNLGGTKLATSYGALSADHIEFLDEAGIEAMAEAGTVAVLLPGAFYTLHETQKPPIEGLRERSVPMA